MVRSTTVEARRATTAAAVVAACTAEHNRARIRAVFQYVSKAPAAQTDELLALQEPPAELELVWVVPSHVRALATNPAGLKTGRAGNGGFTAGLWITTTGKPTALHKAAAAATAASAAARTLLLRLLYAFSCIAKHYSTCTNALAHISTAALHPPPPSLLCLS